MRVHHSSLPALINLCFGLPVFQRLLQLFECHSPSLPRVAVEWWQHLFPPNYVIGNRRASAQLRENYNFLKSTWSSISSCSISVAFTPLTETGKGFLIYWGEPTKFLAAFSLQQVKLFDLHTVYCILYTVTAGTSESSTEI